MTSSTTADEPTVPVLPTTSGDGEGVDEPESVATASTFDRIRDYLAGQIGAVRRVEAGQQSAVALVEAADAEFDELKRVFASARLPSNN